MMRVRQSALAAHARPACPPPGTRRTIAVRSNEREAVLSVQAEPIAGNLGDVTFSCDRRVLVAIGPAMLLIAPSALAKAAAVVSPVTVVTGVLNKLDDIDNVVAQQSKSVVWKLPAAYPGDPVGGEFKGRYGVLTYMTRHKSYYKNAKMTDLKVTPGDGKDQVIARFRFSGNVASGGKFSTSVTQVWRVDPEGSITSMRAYYDTASLAKAAGKVLA